MASVYHLTELNHKVIFQVSVHELHIEMPKKYSSGFYMAYNKKYLYTLVILLFDYFFHQNYER